MRYILAAAWLPLLLLCACGSSGGSQSIASASSASNVATMTVNGGPIASSPLSNVAYVSVTVCAPGTSDCQTINNIQVDTGSYGLRLISTAVSSQLGLPAETSGGDPILECVEFGDGYVWGPVVTADVQVAGEKTTSSVPVQIMGGSSYTVPGGCANNALGGEEDTVQSFGANGILGVGTFVQDCGDACADAVQQEWYYGCPSTDGCTAIEIPLASQVANPVALFPTDNNGVVVELPAISDSGAATATGSLVFGIGTESNNTPPSSVAVLAEDVSEGNSSPGYITTTYNSSTYPDSYIDSGSSILFFNDNSIPQCTEMTGYYCPPEELNLSAVNTGVNGVTSTVDFKVGNAEQLTQDNSLLAFDDIAGPSGTGPGLSGSFDFGLPFFYGRNIYFAIYDQSTPLGVGPYFAY